MKIQTPGIHSRVWSKGCVRFPVHTGREPRVPYLRGSPRRGGLEAQAHGHLPLLLRLLVVGVDQEPGALGGQGEAPDRVHHAVLVYLEVCRLAAFILHFPFPITAAELHCKRERTGHTPKAETTSTKICIRLRLKDTIQFAWKTKGAFLHPARNRHSREHQTVALSRSPASPCGTVFASPPLPLGPWALRHTCFPHAPRWHCLPLPSKLLHSLQNPAAKAPKAEPTPCSPCPCSHLNSTTTVS